MLPAATPALLDTAVPMYAAGSPHRYKLPCAWILQEVRAGRIRAVIDAETIQEILHRYGALQRHADAVAIATDIMTVVPVLLPVTLAAMRLAVSLYHKHGPQGVRARDLVHVAVMQTNGLTHIISPDPHFDQVPGVIRVDPLLLYLQAQSGNP